MWYPPIGTGELCGSAFYNSQVGTGATYRACRGYSVYGACPPGFVRQETGWYYATGSWIGNMPYYTCVKS